MRPALLLALVSACGAKLQVGDPVTDAAAVVHPDAAMALPPDAPPDARGCDGGDAHMVGPDGSCLVLVTTVANYATANAVCTGMSAHLAYLKTADLDTAAEAFIGARDVLVGGTDAATEGTWLWDDGTPLTFTNWRTGEPNNGGGAYEEDCLVIDGSRPGSAWDDRACADPGVTGAVGQFAYLCQY